MGQASLSAATRQSVFSRVSPGKRARRRPTGPAPPASGSGQLVEPGERRAGDLAGELLGDGRDRHRIAPPPEDVAPQIEPGERVDPPGAEAHALVHVPGERGQPLAPAVPRQALPHGEQLALRHARRVAEDAAELGQEHPPVGQPGEQGAQVGAPQEALRRREVGQVDVHAPVAERDAGDLDGAEPPLAPRQDLRGDAGAVVVRDQVPARDPQRPPQPQRHLRLLEQRVRVVRRLVREPEAQVVVDHHLPARRQGGQRRREIPRRRREPVEHQDGLGCRRGRPGVPLADGRIGGSPVVNGGPLHHREHVALEHPVLRSPPSPVAHRAMLRLAPTMV